MEEITVTKVLFGHDSPETAFLVNDYPYGFKLRCKIRYWLEYRKGKGFRFVSQTTNPRLSEEVWNKPKLSMYQPLGVMYLDEKGHTHWTGVSEYSLSKLDDFVVKFGEGLQDKNHQEALQYLTRIRDMRLERFGTV